ncbi:UDP-N-acetylmuramoyl-tripeptide--D-alanyl-D-alanine ligase [Lacticigenium naphthae]|uniref:UDP-N-acetylmuramoyl-tripeptide--D-alanyl-D- alanine ligase n=1 Tax=Lacticigenium naphthae TaxID=515351 RepID=UPI000424466B|nr:UDP-N-acetylmuramoyl-tripeptide--D-alanyl-D-alanine ligase [Lacticigenium naphthae]
MSRLTIKEIADAVSALDHNNEWNSIRINQVAFDTRKIGTDALFVPLKGNRDGHEFIQEAISAGATATLWSLPKEEAPKDFPVIFVEDTLQALQQLAKYFLEKINPRVVGITGSNGKTTTKDMTYSVLQQKYRTYKTQGNYNNEIGMPITILDMPIDTEALVLEMGMSEKGEISFLSHLAEPEVVVITMIGESHIQNLGSRKGIALAKLEIVEGLKEKGTVIIPGNEPLLTENIQVLPTQFVKTFGESEDFTLASLDVEAKLKETYFKTTKDVNKQIKLPIIGKYNVNNALAALLVGETLDISYEECAKGLEHFQLTKNRVEWIDGVNGIQLLNDAYNASPTSMKAVLRYFGDMTVPGNKIAILGDVLELGDFSKNLHESIGEAIDSQHIDTIFLYGKEMHYLYEQLQHAFPEERLFYEKENKDHLVDLVKKVAQPGDCVLVKSSFGTNLLQVVEKLKAKM